MKTEVVFLMYHELELPGRPLCRTEPGYVRYVLTATKFLAQMEWLKTSGWRGLSVTEALTFDGTNVVAMTFDDGSETDLTTAATVLKERGFSATFYATAGFIGTKGYMSSAQLRQLSERGFEIGSHSMTHQYLSDLDDAGLHEEIFDSKARLEEMTGKPIHHFSCPGGRYDRRVATAAHEAGYMTVATSRARANSRSSDPYALGRVAIMRDTPLPDFQNICAGRGLWRVQLGDSLRNGAKQVLGNRSYDVVRERILHRNRSG